MAGLTRELGPILAGSVRNLLSARAGWERVDYMPGLSGSVDAGCRLFRGEVADQAADRALTRVPV
jgi:hypothetical protein